MPVLMHAVWYMIEQIHDNHNPHHLGLDSTSSLAFKIYMKE